MNVLGRETSVDLNCSVRFSRPDCPNVFVWESAGTSSGWEVIKICKHRDTQQTRQLLPQPSPNAFILCSGTCGSACKSVKHCGSLQSAQWGRLILSLLLLLSLLFPVLIYIVFSHATCRVSQKGAVPLDQPQISCLPLLWRGFHTCLTAQRLFDRWPSDCLERCICLCRRSSKQ